jgi:hypothetical protein
MKNRRKNNTEEIRLDILVIISRTIIEQSSKKQKAHHDLENPAKNPVQ